MSPLALFFPPRAAPRGLLQALLRDNTGPVLLVLAHESINQPDSNRTREFVDKLAHRPELRQVLPGGGPQLLLLIHSALCLHTVDEPPARSPAR